jgi:hypothetical protein
MSLPQPVDRSEAAGAPQRQRNEPRQQLIAAAPIRRPLQFIVDEPADDGLLVAPRSTPHLSPAADMAVERRIEDIWKILSRSAARPIVLTPRERHAKVQIRCQRKLRGLRLADGLVGPGAERVEPPLVKPYGSRCAPLLLAAIFP